MPEALHGGRRVSWVEAGQGPAMLMLHAGLARGAAWGPVMELLADRFRLRAPDLPLHGETEHDPARDPQEEAMADAAFLCEGRPAHFVGHSFGATAALHLAVREPQLVRSLTLFEPVYFVFLHDAGDPAHAAYAGEDNPVRDALDRGDGEAALDLFLRDWGGGGGISDPERRRRAIARMPLIMDEPMLVFPDTPGRLTLDAIRALDVPVTLVRGETSPPVIARVLAAIRSAVPQAREVVVPGAGHMCALTHPEAAAEASLGTVAAAEALSPSGR